MPVSFRTRLTSKAPAISCPASRRSTTTRWTLTSHRSTGCRSASSAASWRRTASEAPLRDRRRRQTLHTNAQLDGRRGHPRLPAARRRCDLSTTSSLLASGSSGGDALMPGFANMVQGELAAPPMETLSVHGICAAGVSAHPERRRRASSWARTARAGGGERDAVAPVQALALRGARLRHRFRFALPALDAVGRRRRADCCRTARPRWPAARGLRLRLKWVHQRSFSGDYPVCMQLGPDRGPRDGRTSTTAPGQTAEADGRAVAAPGHPPAAAPVRYRHPRIRAAGARRLDRPGARRPFPVPLLVGKIHPRGRDLMDKAGLAIPRERWYSNLAWRGNTGAASIFIMLAEFLRRDLKPGEQIFCYVPESGRFMAAYMLLEVEAADAPCIGAGLTAQRRGAARSPDDGRRSRRRTTPPPRPKACAICSANWPRSGTTTARASGARRWSADSASAASPPPDYLNWMAATGSRRCAKAASGCAKARPRCRRRYQSLAALIEHARGRRAERLHDPLRRLPQGRRHGRATSTRCAATRAAKRSTPTCTRLAATPNPIGLLGAIYIIEGTGQRIVPALLPLMKASLKLPPEAFRFLEYHGAQRREPPAPLAARGRDGDGASTPRATASRQIIATARHTAELYLMQFEHVHPKTHSPSDDADMSPSTPDFLTEPHDPRDPSPWLALYLDHSTPIRRRGQGGVARRFEFAFAAVRAAFRAAAGAHDHRADPGRQGVRAAQLVAFSRVLHRMLAWGMKHFVSPEANWLILRHFHLGSQVLAFIGEQLAGAGRRLNPLEPAAIADVKRGHVPVARPEPLQLRHPPQPERCRRRDANWNTWRSPTCR